MLDAADIASSASLEALLDRIGPRWAEDINAHRDAVQRAYLPLLEAHALPGLRVTRELAYGPHARQRLDIYQPLAAQQAGSALPVMVFVHGGAFIRGNKDANAQIYANVARFFARHGFVGVNVEYRLAPEARFPEGAEDVALALDWLRSRLPAYGANASRLLLIGHSAGGTHVASLLCDPRLQERRPPVAGAVLISARLRADVLASNPNAEGVRAYFGADPARHAQDSPVVHAGHLRVPTLVAVAEHENPWLDVYAMEFCQRVGQARGRTPPLLWVPRHNHSSIVAHLDSLGGQEPFGLQLLDFARGLAPSD